VALVRVALVRGVGLGRLHGLARASSNGGRFIGSARDGALFARALLRSPRPHKAQVQSRNDEAATAVVWSYEQSAGTR